MLENLIILFVPLIVVSEFTSADNNVDYCSIKTCKPRSHVMCRHPNPGPAARCKEILGIGLGAKDKEAILKYHNDLRETVASGKEMRGSPGPQPPAVNMSKLEWDDELATIAQRWANQCSYSEDTCRNVARFPVGQNLAFSLTIKKTSDFNFKSLVRKWSSEVAYHDRNRASNYTRSYSVGPRSRLISHYTQMVWGKTQKIGCGAIKFRRRPPYRSVTLVCNYGPAGNRIGEPLYDVKQI